MRAAKPTQRFSTIVALLAMVLLVVAPLISKMVLRPHENARHAQAMPERHLADTQQASAAALRGVATHRSHAHHGVQSAPSHHTDHDSACSYCELLQHTPLLLWVAACLLWLLQLLWRLVFAPKPTPAPLPSWRTLRQPRAPPHFTVSLTH